MYSSIQFLPDLEPDKPSYSLDHFSIYVTLQLFKT